ncbi:MAG: cytochrome c oxidase subunit 3 [Chitinophagales bacterium]|jgi:cytochrome c oxidase subunit 3|nr:cytochrome c oxidase subunit 3 [Chitinophagales bacterium]HNL07813.1 cytochrome c oxidase subunit 3 [Chitinophagales bacterium]
MNNEPFPPSSWQPKLPVQKIMAYLAIAAISVLFVTLTMAYKIQSQHWHWETFPFPKIFFATTFAIIVSSYTMQATVKAFKRSDTLSFQQLLGATIVLGALFMLGQVAGWYNLHKNGIFFDGKLDGAYLYLLSGLHVLHLLVGWLLLIYLLQKNYRIAHQPTEMVLFYNEPIQLTRVEIIAIYWHFVDILWLYLLFFLLLNHT